MSKKIGRNDPCWCGSEKKYKKCHLNRETDEPLKRSDIEKHSKQVTSTKKCSVDNFYRNKCSGSIVKAHTISKSGSLRQIAEDGHVMGTNPSFSQLDKTQGKLTLTKVGIGKASTFSGFCSYHDKNLFVPLEDIPITLSNEQLFLLAYRSLSRELYAKEGNLKTVDFLRQADRGKDLLGQFILQASASSYGIGVDLALKELIDIKSQMDEMLKASDFSQLNHCVIELATLPNVLVSASTQPEFDFNGNRLQQFGQSNVKMSHIVFNCISYDDRGCFVFSWLDDSNEVCEKFIDSLLKLEKHDICNALVRFCYSFAENTWASPRWWESLNRDQQNSISDRLQHGMPHSPHQPDCLTPDGINFSAYQISKIDLRKSSSLQGVGQMN